MLPTHASITFVPAKNSTNAYVSIRKEVDEDIYDIISEFFDQTFKRNGKLSQWIVKASEAHDICLEVDRLIEEFDNEDDESDDELIQEALRRRYKSQSSGKVIDDEQIEDSDVEHVTSLSRRLRHIYRLIDALSRRVQHLESNQVSIDSD